jgi:8-amino-7-oxononanoate synthase
MSAVSLSDMTAERVAKRRESGLYRRLRTVERTDSDDPNRLRIDGKDCVAFCGNDYLSLRTHPVVIDACKRGAEAFGVGSGASQLISGHTAEHRRLEEELADFLGRPRVVLFSSGYLANLGAVGTLMDRHDTVFEDRLNHASLLDAARLSGARLKRYRHRDAGALAERLAGTARGKRLVASDGVFSMDGDIARLPELAKQCARHDAWLMVDDAHGFGVLGSGGRGTVEHFGLVASDVPVLMVTFGKALGSAGAAVAGAADLIDMLIQHARTCIYTTALPPPVVAAARAALAIVRDDPAPRQCLHANVARFRAAASQNSLPVCDSETPIQPLLIGDNRRTARIGDFLIEHGYWVGAIRPPTVPDGTARLRITLSSAHRPEQIDGLIDTLGRAFAAVPE